MASATARSSRARLRAWWRRPVAALPVLVLLAALVVAGTAGGALAAAGAGLVPALLVPALGLVALIPALRRAWARARPGTAWPERPTTLHESPYSFRGFVYLMTILLGSTLAWGVLAILLAEFGVPDPASPLLAVVLTAPVFAELDFRLGRRTTRRLKAAAQRLEASVQAAEGWARPIEPVTLRARGLRALLPGRPVLLTLAPDGLEVPGAPRVPWRDVGEVVLFDLYGRTLLGVVLERPLPEPAPMPARLNRALLGYDLVADVTPARLAPEEVVGLLAAVAPEVPVAVSAEVL